MTRLLRLAAMLVALCAGGVALAAAAAPADDIVALQLAPWTGGPGETGWNANVGLQLSFDEANAAGGVRGHRLRLVFEEEDAADPARQLRELHRQWSPVALVGSVDPEMLRRLAQGGVLDELQLPAIGLASGDTRLRQLASPYLVVTRPGFADELKAVFAYLATLNARRVALVLSPPQAAGLARDVPALARAAGITVVIRVDYADETPAAVAAGRVVATPHDAVIVAAGTGRTSDFCRAYKASGAVGQLVSLSTAEPTRLASFSSKAVARGVVFALTVPNPRNRNLPLVHEFLNAFTRFGPAGVSPTTSMLESYIAGRVLVDALRHAPSPTSAGVAGVLARSPSSWIAGLQVYLHDKGDANRASLTVLDSEGRMLW